MFKSYFALTTMQCMFGPKVVQTVTLNLSNRKMPHFLVLDHNIYPTESNFLFQYLDINFRNFRCKLTKEAM